MPLGMQEYNKVKNELVGLGYSMRYVNEWQPKIRLYRHKPAYNIEGDLTDEVGTHGDNVPGEPRYLLRKAQMGLFGFPPSETCECSWCQERQAEGAAEAALEPATAGTGTKKGVMGPHFKN